MIVQLRPFYSPEQLKLIYDHQYDHTKWSDHIERIAHTAALLKEMAPATVADLSCGDAAIVEAAGLLGVATLGDFTGGYEYSGRIEDTIQQIPAVDVFLLSETLEHVEDPLSLLKAIRGKASRLLLSTPHGETHTQNWEHYWGWDHEGLEQLLTQSGWQGTHHLFTPESCAYYTFQIWRCS